MREMLKDETHQGIDDDSNMADGIPEEHSK
jgi:hypothetical protein